MMKELITIVTMITMAIIASSPAVAGNGCCCSALGVGYSDITEVPGLNLTKKQISQITSLRENHINPLQQKMYGKRNELRILLWARPPDQRKLEVVEKELIAIREQPYEKHAVYRQEVLKILTTKQQAKLRASGFSI